MKKYLLPALAIALLVSCEDYTERYFGKPEELFASTQVNANMSYTLDDVHYEALAANADNKALALSQDTADHNIKEPALRQKALQRAARMHLVPGALDPTAYLRNIIREIMPPAAYYSVTPGTQITLKYLQSTDSLVREGYRTLQTMKEGSMLLRPAGMSQVLSDAELQSTGVLYLSGTKRIPQQVRSLDADLVGMDAGAKAMAFEFIKNGDKYIITAPTSNMDVFVADSSAKSLSLTDAVNEMENMEKGLWSVSIGPEGKACIQNSATGRELLYNVKRKCLQALSKEDTVGGKYLPLELLCHTTLKSYYDAKPVMSEAVFVLSDSGWVPKKEIAKWALAGGQSATSSEDILAHSGWTIHHVGNIGTLTYVWKLDNRFGLRSSAYVGGKKTEVESWAISPEVGLEGATRPVLIFDEAQKYNEGKPLSEYLKVYISTEAGTGKFNADDWEDVTEQIVGARPDGSNWDYVTVRLPLQTYAGKSHVRLAFVYVCDGKVAPTWEVKNVIIRNANSEDEAALSQGNK